MADQVVVLHGIRTVVCTKIVLCKNSRQGLYHTVVRRYYVLGLCSVCTANLRSISPSRSNTLLLGQQRSVRSSYSHISSAGLDNVITYFTRWLLSIICFANFISSTNLTSPFLCGRNTSCKPFLPKVRKESSN